jgi:hypothetical protein
MESFPVLPSDGPCLYGYWHKRAFHIRVATDYHEISADFYRSFRRIILGRAQVEALGLDLEFLQAYMGSTKHYFHARMAMNQNRPDAPSTLKDHFPDFVEQEIKVRKCRYDLSRIQRDSAWKELARLRKIARPLLLAKMV